jgi:hypothetical protein
VLVWLERWRLLSWFRLLAGLALASLLRTTSYLSIETISCIDCIVLTFVVCRPSHKYGGKMNEIMRSSG